MPSTLLFPDYIFYICVELYYEAYNRRFPKHELFPYILDTQILEEKENDSIRYLKRRVTLEIDAPEWFKMVIRN